MNIYSRLFLAFISFSVISYINGLLAINVTNNMINSLPLPDVGFYYLPRISNFYPNLMLVSFYIYFCTRFIRFRNINQLISLLWCITILFIFRSITFVVTTVPPAITNCYNRNSTDPIEWNVLKFLLTSDDNTCIDYMFSGHAVYYVILYMFILELTTNIVEKTLSTIYIVFGLLSIISGHIHYTVDVIIAIILSYGCYYMNRILQ